MLFDGLSNSFVFKWNLRFQLKQLTYAYNIKYEQKASTIRVLRLEIELTEEIYR